MKKTLYSICFASSILFASSCTEDRGTSTEVADANENEYVDPNHIRESDNEEMSSTGDMGADSDMAHLNRSQEIASKMASDMSLDEATQDRVATIFYERDKMLSDIDNSYNFSETNQMGGRVGTAEENDLSVTTPEPTTDNNPRNEMENRGNMNENNAELTEMRSTIIVDADKDLRAVLTEEQFKKFEENRSKYDHVSHTTDNKSMSNDTQMNKTKGDKTEVKSRN